jgi:hypothetical protein
VTDAATRERILPANALPVNLSAEQSILGAILLDNSCYAQAASLLRADDFSLDSHRRVYAHMCTLGESGRPIDFVTLTEELTRNKELEAVGGIAYITSLTDGLPRAQNIESYIRIVRDKAGKRYAAREAEAIMHAAMDGIGLSDLAARCAEMGQHVARYETASGVDLSRIPDPLELPREPEAWIVPGLVLKAGITVLAGEPGAGKTWLALLLARAVGFGGDYLDRKCQRAKVVILDFENPRSIIQERWNTIFHGPVKGHVTLWAAWSGLGEVPKVGDPRLTEVAQPNRLVIVDTLSGAHSAKDENSAAEMAPVLAFFRTMANQGAAILLLHHRGKNELTKYRGSSAIAAGVDIAAALSKSEDGPLTLHVFKSRATPEYKLTIQPDFEAGTFEVVDSPGKVAYRDDVATIKSAINENPGLSANKIVELTAIRRQRAWDILKRYVGTHWRVETEGKANRYFPMEAN